MTHSHRPFCIEHSSENTNAFLAFFDVVAYLCECLK